MFMRGLTNILGYVASVIAIIGIILYYTVGNDWVIWCATFGLISSIMAVMWGGQNSLITEIIAFFVGLIVADISKLPFIQTIALALCYETTTMSIIAIGALGFFVFKDIRRVNMLVKDVKSSPVAENKRPIKLKQAYCKHCGKPLNMKTGKCTGCNKKYRLIISSSK